MIRGFNESKLTTSEVFNGNKDHPGINNMKTPTLAERAVTLIKTAKHLTNEDMEAAYISVKQITDALTQAALKAFDSEKVVFLYNKDPNQAMIQALPFLTGNTKNGYTTYVFADKYIRTSREGITNIEPSIFRDFITAGVVANGLKEHYSALQSNTYLQSTLMDIYCQLFIRVLNREYSFAPNKVLYDTIRYWVNRYFLDVVFGSIDSEENKEALASAHVRELDELGRQSMKSKYDEASVTDLSGLLEVIKGSATRFSSLAIGMFLNDWTNYYYAPAMLAVDNIEYLIFMVITLLSGNNIINVSASEVVKNAKNIKPIRSELLKLI